jgi:DNA-binding NtrC family response regulator
MTTTPTSTPAIAPIHLLIIDDDRAVHLYIKSVLGKSYQISSAFNRIEAITILKQKPIDIVLLDLVLSPFEDGMELLKTFKQLNEELDVIVISNVQMVQTVVAAMQEGAIDYMVKPLEQENLLLSLNRVVKNRQLQRHNIFLKQALSDSHNDSEIIGASPAIEQVKTMVGRLKGQAVNVFIVGDTGTGKEMFARLIHQQEQDANRPFVSLNCAAIPENLLESMLFGHEKGSFTGATEKRIGKFEMANGGDIFLDEISCLSLELQAKLLRVIEEKEVERVGGSIPKKVNFRVISASNDNIIQLVASGQFRKDLFYRLNTVTLQLPTLNQRREDIIPLAESFLSRYRRTPQAKTLSAEVQELLTNHNWQGNVRELKNTIENLIIFSKDDVIQLDDIPFLVREEKFSTQLAVLNDSASKPSTSSNSAPNELQHLLMNGKYQEVIQQIEKKLITMSLQRNRWNKTRACKEIGIKRNKLYRKMVELGIDYK